MLLIKALLQHRCPEGYTGSNTADWDDAGSKWTITCTDITSNGDQAIDQDENLEVNKEGLDLVNVSQAIILMAINVLT